MSEYYVAALAASLYLIVAAALHSFMMDTGAFCARGSAGGYLCGCEDRRLARQALVLLLGLPVLLGAAAVGWICVIVAAFMLKLAGCDAF